MLETANRTLDDADLSLFRAQVRRFFLVELVPNLERWDRDGKVDRAFWRACGATGLLCPTVPEVYGGLGLDFRYNVVVNEELAYAGSTAGIILQSDMATGYIVQYASEEWKRRLLPEMVAGRSILALALTEPDAGSDLRGIRTTARRDGEHYVVNGSKTYISNGQNADVAIVAAKADAEGGSASLTLLLVECDRPGFVKGRKLDKIGQHSADTSELFFADIRIPVGNRLGEDGRGFRYLMEQLPRERLSIAILAQAAAQRAFDEAQAFTHSRRAFGATIFDLQNTKFTLARLAARLQVGRAHIDWAVFRHIEEKLSAAEAAAAKLFHTELQWDVVDAALQMHGAAGYMNETFVARLWRDARANRILGGSSEIMCEIIARSL